MQLEVDDAPGRATDKNRVVAYAYPAGKRDSTLASLVFVNPMSLILAAGVPFDIDLSLDSGKHLILTNQIVQEGQSLTLNVNAGDFK